MSKANLILPDLDSIQPDTSRLEEAIQHLLPDQDFFTTVIQDSSLVEQITTLTTQAEQLPAEIQAIAKNTEQTLETEFSAIENTFEQLLDALNQLPITFKSTLTTELEENAQDLLDTLESQVINEWQQLPQHTAEQLESAVTNGFTEFIAVAQQAENFFRETLQRVLAESEQYLVEHIENAVESSADELKHVTLERVSDELITSQAVLLIGSQTTATLSPLLPYIKAAHILATEIKDLLDKLDQLGA